MFSFDQKFTAIVLVTTVMYSIRGLTVFPVGEPFSKNNSRTLC